MSRPVPDPPPDLVDGINCLLDLETQHGPAPQSEKESPANLRERSAKREIPWTGKSRARRHLFTLDKL
ncbi:MAG TPA: hypothetical protein VGM62_13070 [Chthoniobacterales bacterium]